MVECWSDERWGDDAFSNTPALQSSTTPLRGWQCPDLVAAVLPHRRAPPQRRTHHLNQDTTHAAGPQEVIQANGLIPVRQQRRCRWFGFALLL